MSSERGITRRSAALSLLALAGCGFTPALGGGGVPGGVALTTPETVAGFALRRQLLARLGTGSDLALAVDLTEDRVAAAITVDGDTTRFSLVGRADWVLTRGGVELARGSEETFANYSTTGTTVATQTAEDDARQRLAIALADLIAAQVLLAAA